jgi:ribosome hibernation promoting factor
VKQKPVPISVTFRHIAPTDALRAHAEKRLSHLVPMVPGVTDVHVVLSATAPHHHRQLAEITVHGRQHVLTASDETNDMYAAIDLAAGKIESQIRTLKGKLIQAPRRNSAGPRRSGTSPTDS